MNSSTPFKVTTSVNRMLFTAFVALTVWNESLADERPDRRDSQCQSVPSKKERAAKLHGRDSRAMEREGYPSDSNVLYQRAKEIGDMRAAWGAIIMVREGAGRKTDLNRADELWRDYWCSQVLPAFEEKPHIALETLKAAANRGLPSAMIRLSEVYARGEFGQPVQQQLSSEWKRKHDAAKVRQE